MKNINIAIVFILVFRLQSFSQEVSSDSISVVESDSIVNISNPTETEKMILTLYQKIDSLSVKEEKEDIGFFQLYNFYPNVYSKSAFLSKINEKKKDEKEYNHDLKNIRKGASAKYEKKVINLFEKVESVEIENVVFNISEGVIENIRVKMRTSKSNDIRIFENISPIPLQNMDIAAVRIFLYDVRDRDYFLKINDFMYFLPNPGQYYLPDDTSCTLNRKDTVCKVNASVDLNSNLDIRVYSDFLSLFNKESNGLLQTEAKTRIIVNSIPTISSIYFLNFIEPSVRYSKFDSEYSSVKIKDSAEPVVLSELEKLEMNQLSYLNLGFKLNVIRTKLFQSFTELNVGCTYDFVDIQLSNSSENIPANMFSYYIEDRGGIAKSKYFGLNYSLGILWQNISKTGLNDISVSEAYIIPELTAYFFHKENSSNRLFLRFRSFSNILTGESFPVFQFGYSTKLNFRKN